MKRFLIIVLALTLISFHSNAQFFTLGPKIGLSSSKITVAKDVEAIAAGDAEVGFHAGLFTRITVLGFYLQPEVMFTSTSGNIVIDDQEVTNNYEAVQNLTYNKLDVPVMLGIKIGKVIRVNAGPTFTFILSEDFRDNTAIAIDAIRQDPESANVGYQVGIGLDISKLVIDLKYENNLNALGETVTFPIPGGEDRIFPTDMRNRLIQLTVGWKLL